MLQLQVFFEENQVQCSPNGEIRQDKFFSDANSYFCEVECYLPVVRSVWHTAQSQKVPLMLFIVFLTGPVNVTHIIS